MSFHLVVDVHGEFDVGEGFGRGEHGAVESMQGGDAAGVDFPVCIDYV